MKKFRDIEAVKEDLRSAVDLVDIIGRYVPLSQSGKRWVGFCPFHDDKHKPDFSVSPETVWKKTGAKGVWGCWACNVSGDLFAFIQRIHNMDFFESINLVAEIAEFDLTPYYRTLTPEERLREDQYTVVEQIAALFHETLMNEPKRLKFFLQKGLEPETLRIFQVGWCPSLTFAMSNIEDEVFDFIEPDRSRRSRLFGNRYMYSQFTATGRIWGWFGRQTSSMTPGPKYWSTSTEAALYDAQGRLYGLFQARKLLRGAETPLLGVEGFNDAMMSHQGGLPAVAWCGTELSADQVHTLGAHAIRRMTVCLDGDRAGRAAMLKLATEAHKFDSLDLQFIDVPGEPEQFIFERGIAAFGQRIENALSPVDYIIERHASEIDTSSATKKRDFLEHVRPFLAPYPSRSLNRALGIQAIARITGLSEDVISDYLEEHTKSPLMNLTGEMVVLAELATNPIAWITLQNISERDFSLKRYAKTYSLMRELSEDEAEVNVELLVMHAINSNAPAEVREVISKLPGVQTKNATAFAEDIRDKSIRREALRWTESMRRNVSDPQNQVGESIAYMIEGLTDAITSSTDKTTFSSVEAVDLTITEIERRSEEDSGIAGLDLGPDWAWITEMLNGLRQKCLICIAAFTNVGKSLVLANWLHKLSVVEDFGERPAPRAAGLVVSMEMNVDENCMRLCAIDSGLPHSSIEHARFTTQEEVDMMMRSMDRIKKSRLTWYTGIRSMRDISMKARLLQARGELDYIAIDYIQLLDLTSYTEQWSPVDKFNRASQEIKNLAENLSVPIITLAQCNRGASEVDIPDIQHMGSSIKIAQDSNSILFLAPREHGLVGSLGKNRGSGRGVVKLAFDTNEKTSSLWIREIDSGKKPDR